MTRRNPGGLGRLQVANGRLHLEVLDDDGHHLSASLPVDGDQQHALHHLHASQTARACARHDHRPVIDLLLDTLGALEAQAVALVVEGGPPTTFRLDLRSPRGRLEVPLDVVDAAALIFSRRVPLRVLAPAVDWDDTIAQLLSA